MIHEKLKEDLKDAMRAKDALRLSSIRSLLAMATNELLAKKSSSDFLDDDGMNTLIKRAVKQRRDSIEQFKAGGRQDLADSEEAELKLLEVYLPKMASKEEVEKVAKAKKAELNITDKTKIGQLTGVVMKEFKGNVDGNLVKSVLDSLFS